MTTNDKIIATTELLKKYGNYRIRKRLRNHGYQWSEELRIVTHDIAEYYDAMNYLIESDQAWSKEFTELTRNYKQVCKIAYKLMIKEK